MKIQNPLKYYTDKLKNGEKFSLARYGDGELLCMWGKSGGNSNGCAYTPELRQALLDSMEPREGFIHGLQRVLPRDEENATRDWPVQWHDTEVFSEAAAEATKSQLVRNYRYDNIPDGDFKDFVREMYNLPVTIIGNYSIRGATKGIFPHRWFIEVSPTNAYVDKDKVIRNILWEDRFATEPKIYLFSCGMAANAFISELHGRVNGWLIDVGHIWDPFAGSKSRCDLQ